MIVLHVMLVVLGAAAMWWLSGYDTQVKGENKRRDLIRRVARCLATVILLVIFFGPNAVRIGYAFIPLILIVPAAIGILWAGCIGASFAQGIHRVIDSDDRRPFDFNERSRNLDLVASLLKSGRYEEAAQLCEALKKSGDANILVLETMLARSGIQFDRGRKPKPLTEAYRLRAEGKPGEAETILQSLLAKNPSDVDAALMLMRLYAQDLRRSDKAAEVLRSLEKQPHIPSAHLEYARRSINEWSQRKSAPAAEILPESVDELLACGYLGTAIEILEGKIKEQPADFDLRLKLAEAHGRHARNFQRAEKIVQQIETSPGFNAGQIQLARARLGEWREAKPWKH
jgi:thioredoxin-like negative regulator of GroEL